jgi:pyruvate/2-oxoglutarate dehydrogenase complex dihydrolipoamide dehydrogenase (E3) component
MSKRYDIVVIGAGAGGLTAALTAHRRGAKVIMLERDKIGGECTHSGCVPSKAFLHAAHTFHAVQGLGALGLSEVRPTSDFRFGDVMENVDEIVQRIYDHERPEVFEAMGLDTIVHPSGARFIDDHTVEIGGERIEADHFVICTGSKPRMIDIVGHDPLDYLSNENFWEIREQPPALVFLGGGVIATELGQAMARLGCEVTVVDRNAHILKAADAEVAELATTLLRSEGVRIVTEAEITACEQRGPDDIRISMNQGGQPTELQAGRVFVALGREPNVSGLDLDRAGVAFDPVRGIRTNAHLQTSAPHIYACGDVATAMKFTHVADYQARVCIDNILGGNRVSDLSNVPWSIFVEPEISHVGLNEAQARERLGAGVRIARADAATVDRFITDRATDGFVKIVMDADDLILGADAIGERSGEWIQLISLAIQNGMHAQDFAETIFTYPSYATIVRRALMGHLQP